MTTSAEVRAPTALDLTDDDPSGTHDRAPEEPADPEEPITSDAVEDQLRETVQVAEQAVEDNEATLVGVAAGGLVVLVVVVFLLGRRRGRRKATTVELVEL